MTIRSLYDKTPNIASSAFVDDSAVIIGDVIIGENSSVWPMAVIRGDVQTIRIGKGTNIQDACVLHVTHDHSSVQGGLPLLIGDWVTAGHNVILHACSIGDYCLIGMSSTIMDGAVLGARLIIGAGSLVPPGKNLESGYLYVGSPVRKVRLLTEEELATLEYSATHYIKLKDSYLANVRSEIESDQ